MTKKNQQDTKNSSTCVHTTYHGMRVPKGDCSSCWIKYFSSDTDNKQKKYPTEFEKYMTKTVIAKITSKKSEKSILTVEDVLEEIPITKPRPTTDDSNLRKNANGEQVADIPIKLNRYFWSETLKASVKLVGFSNNLLAFQIDQRILMPLNKYKWSDGDKIPPIKFEMILDNTTPQP